MPHTIRTAIDDIHTRMRAATPAGAQAARLIAVGKGHDAVALQEALQAGQRLFGENRVQEAVQKWPALKEAYPHTELHLIGPLQTNKVRQAVALFDVIQTVDRESLAQKLRTVSVQAGKADMPLLIQINTGEEPQKAGIVPSEAGEFYRYCRQDLGLNICGLMCIPPRTAAAAAHFECLKDIGARLISLHPSAPRPPMHLSMGMSADFETAVRLGTTYVRVGSAIFGARTP